MISIGIPFRMLIFFRNVHVVGDAYDYVATKIGQGLNCPIPDRTVHMYHLTTSDIRKKLILQMLTSPLSKTQVIFCTSSFSLGLNLSHIHFVVHYGVPSSVEDSVQETGRLARERGHMVTPYY